MAVESVPSFKILNSPVPLPLPSTINPRLLILLNMVWFVGLPASSSNSRKLFVPVSLLFNLLSAVNIISPLNVCVSLVVSPNIFEPSVWIIEDVIIDDVNCVVLIVVAPKFTAVKVS